MSDLFRFVVVFRVVFFAVFFFADFFVADFLVADFRVAFFGTFLPARRASDNPIAIACLRLVTFFLLRPDFSVPFFRFFITRRTLSEALFEYLRAMWSPCRFVPWSLTCISR